LTDAAPSAEMRFMKRDQLLGRLPVEPLSAEAEHIEHILPTRPAAPWWEFCARDGLKLGNIALVTTARRDDDNS
jgi:hypothetical protein